MNMKSRNGRCFAAAGSTLLIGGASFILFGFSTCGLGQEASPDAFPRTVVSFQSESVLPRHGSVSDFWFYAETTSPQLALMNRRNPTFVAALEPGQEIRFSIPLGFPDDALADDATSNDALRIEATGRIGLLAELLAGDPIDVMLGSCS